MDVRFILTKLKSLALTPEQFAKSTGIQPRTMKHILRGYIPSKIVRANMAMRLGCEEKDLVLSGAYLEEEGYLKRSA